ncbi:pyridoxamine 5'-phosphate oxidase family protein [Aquimarina algicola]|uniref:Pyridoxamine 5'-phosphate oxidase family protein n=1 Tax=Aquimarina algicola TaxID=2589995 RepID=A0A504JCP1_9FLAO|nr:pyridoxamine 5'-phosphate oxidase family protein [Aquimarina algicola]TPN88756.1 pyridoxamine 5'-phosphate oxidase family protein [Aquimarina algicola]
MSEYSVSKLNKVVRGPKRASYDVATINTILDDAFLCHIGYVYNGEAIVIPTAYGRKGNKIYIHGSLKNRMMLSLLASGKASISVTHLDGLVLARSAFHHSANYRSVTIFGHVEKIEDPTEKMEALACILNHMVPEHWDNVRPPNQKEFKATLVMAITIDTASAKTRAEGVNDEAEDYETSYWAGVVPIKQVAFDAIADETLSETIKMPKSVENYIQKNK